MTKKRQRRTKKKKLTAARLITFLVLIAVVYVAQTFTGHEADDGASSSALPSTSAYMQADSLMMVVTNPDLPQIPLRYTGMDISFNQARHLPNWVAWELTADETTGVVKRSTKFITDVDVAGSADPSDYTNSGFDRGHMAPAGDMKWSPDAMMHSFYMTNICPQAKPLNTGAWKNLEEKCRVWARAEGRLIIVCGPVLTDSLTQTIGATKVAVPERFFKVVLAPAANPPRGIGFIMPNSAVKGGMQASATSIDEVERITGHDFFSALPDDIENDVESQNDFNFWSTIK